MESFSFPTLIFIARENTHIIGLEKVELGLHPFFIFVAVNQHRIYLKRLKQRTLILKTPTGFWP